MSLMSRSKFGSSSTFIDDSEVLFSSTTGSHGGGSDDDDAKSKWSSADGGGGDDMTSTYLFDFTTSKGLAGAPAPYILWSFPPWCLSHDVSYSRYQIRVYMCCRQPFVVSLSVPSKLQTNKTKKEN